MDLADLASCFATTDRLEFRLMFAGITFSRRGMFDKAETTEQTEESGSKSQKALARLGLQVNSAPQL